MSRARVIWSPMVDSVPSVWSSQPTASSALRTNCCWLDSEDRIRIAVVAPVGSSDGRLISRPVVSCSCALATRSMAVCMPLNDWWLSMFWVIRHQQLDSSRDPTIPVRLIRVSSISSTVVMTRAAAS